MSEKKSKPEVTKKPVSRNKIIILLGCVIAAGVLTTAGILFIPKLIHMMNKEETAASDEKSSITKNISFITLPELLVNLKMYQGKGAILKTTFVLQVAHEKEVEEINRYIPVITDQFQTFLREMTVVDLQGAAGIERIRQELLVRINQIIKPAKIMEVLVKDFLVQ
jgi:flagellar FliL protein